MVFISEKLQGIVQRVTYHNPSTGWSAPRIQSYANPGEQLIVTIHQARVFPGVTIEFGGA